MTDLNPRVLWAAGALVALAAYTWLASFLFLSIPGLLALFLRHAPRLREHYDHATVQWWSYLWCCYAHPTIGPWLATSGVPAAVATSAPIGYAAWRYRAASWSLRRSYPINRMRPAAPVRSASSVDGNAREMTHREMRWRWRAKTGIAIGELFDPRERPGIYNPRDRSTWGEGGKARVAVEPMSSFPVALTVAGSGAGKSTMAATTLAKYWTDGAVVLDPKRQLAEMCVRARYDMGHRVCILDTETANRVGMNVLRGINPRSIYAETQLNNKVEQICGATPRDGGNSRFFKNRGKAIVQALLGHMLWDPDLPDSFKTLEFFVDRMSVDEDQMRKTMRNIARRSACPRAQRLARQLSKMPDETWGGVFASAVDDTNWLTTSVNAKLVSGNAIKPADIVRNGVDVFISLPPMILDTAEALPRVIIGSLLDALYQANGKIRGKRLFLLDEVARLKQFRDLRVMRDYGRDYGIRGWLFYQAESQIDEQFGHGSREAWIQNAGLVTYMQLRDYEAAERVSRAIGEYTAVARSQSIQQTWFGATAWRRGRTINFSERRARLIPTSTLMNNIPPDTVIALGGGGRYPAVMSAALCYRRDDLRHILDDNPFGPDQSDWGDASISSPPPSANTIDHAPTIH